MTRVYTGEIALEFKLASTFHDLRELLGPWRSAFARRERFVHVTAAPEWTYGLWFLHSANPGFRVLSVWDEARLAVALPYIEDARPGRTPRLQALCEIVPFFARDCGGDAVRFAILALQQIYGRFEMCWEQMEVADPDASTLLTAACERGLQVDTLLTHRTVIVDLALGWDAYWDGLSANTKEGLRKARARMAAAGVKCRYTTHADRAQIAASFDRVLQVDSRSWKQQRGGSMARSGCEHAQFRAALETLAERGCSRIYLLELNAEPAAFVLSAVSGRQSYFAIWTYADHLSYFMPGKLLMAYALAEAAAEGIRKVDFWGRFDQFKASWGAATTDRYRVFLHSGGWRYGKAAVAMRRAALRVRAIAAGDPERYRLRVDAPAWIGRRVVSPVTRCIRCLRVRRTPGLRVRPEDRAGSIAVTVRRATERDKWKLGSRPAAGGEWMVFESGGALLGSAATEPLLSREHLWIRDLRFLTDQPDERRESVVALLVARPEVRFVYGERAAAQRAGSDCAVRLLRERRHLVHGS